MTRIPDPAFALSFADIIPWRDLAYIGGSILAPWANAGSDVDLFVLYDRPRCTDGVSLNYWEEAGRMVDVTYRRLVDVEAEIDALESQASLPDAWDAERLPGHGQLDFLERLAGGMPLAGQERLRRLQQRVRSTLPAVLGRHWNVVARASWTDAVGAYRSGDYAQCLIACVAVIQEALDGYCALNGRTALARKWRMAKLRHLEVDPMGYLDMVDVLWFPSCADALPEALEGWLSRAASVLFTLQYRLVTGTYPTFLAAPPPLTRLEVTPRGYFVVDQHHSARLSAREVGLFVQEPEAPRRSHVAP